VDSVVAFIWNKEREKEEIGDFIFILVGNLEQEKYTYLLGQVLITTTTICIL
jgi:hypothetical protein